MSEPVAADWVGRTLAAEDEVTAAMVEGLRATLDLAGGRPSPGDEAPAGMHWLLAPERAPQRELGPDGHPRRGRFLPPIALPRRMWAAGALELVAPLRVGDRVRRLSRIAAVSEKTGRSGRLAFVEVDHEITVAGAPRLRERQTIVYRDVAGAPAADAGAAPGDAALAAGDWPWRREVRPDPVLLFRYSALTFNGHRIHYDRDHARRVEGYPDLVVHGPLVATWLLQLCADGLGGAAPAAFAFRARSPAFVDQPLALCARPDGAGVALAAFAPGGRLVMTAEAGRG